MPISFKKTWEKACNIALANTGTQLGNDQQLLHRIVTEMVNPALTSPWVAVASSDGVSAGAGNLWAAPADVLPGGPGVPHSWIVLQQDGVAPGFQLCLDLGVDSNARTLTVVWSFAGFDVGAPSALNRPTAADEAIGWTERVYGYGNFPAPAAAYNLSVIVSDDGESTMIWNIVGANCAMLFIFAKPLAPPAGWAFPFVALNAGNVSTAEAVNYLPITNPDHSNTGNAYFKASASEGMKLAKMAAEGYDIFYGLGTGTTLDRANEASNEWPLGPCVVWCEEPGGRGEWGYLPDFLISTITPATGDTFPTGGSRQLIQIGDFAVPWDGSVTPTGGVERDADVLTGVVDEPYDFAPNEILNANQAILGNPSLFTPQPRPI